MSGAIAPLPRVFVALALAFLVCSALVLGLGREPWLTRATSLTGVGLAALCAALSRSHATTHIGRGHRITRIVALLVLGAALAVPGWFFGPNGGWAAVIAIALLLTGLLTGARPEPRPTLEGWVAYLAIAAGQALVFLQVGTGAWPDVSLTPVLVGDHPLWHHALAHLFVQSVYLGAFAMGRAFQRRYASLVAEVERSGRESERRQALLDEARAEYQRTLDAGRAGLRGGLRSAPPPAGEDGAETGRHAPSSKREAPDLCEWVAAHGPLEHDEARSLLECLCDAVGRLHARGLAHHGVSPLAVRRSADGFRLSAAGARDPGAVEAVRAMAPERLRGPSGPAADVFAVAATMHLALTGRGPYSEHADAAAVTRAILEGPPELDGLPHDLTEALSAGLRADPDARIDLAGLREALAAALDAPAATPAPAPPPANAPSRLETPAGEGDAPWRVAHGEKMRALHLGATGFCVGGALLLQTVADHPRPLLVAQLGLAGILAMVWLQAWLRRRGEDRYWPWVVAAALSVAPGYSIGLHSGYVAAVCLLLFAGGLFQAGRADRRVAVLAAVLAAHAALFLAVAWGLLPDESNVPLLLPGQPVARAWTQQALVLALLGASFAGGHAVDRRMQALEARVRDAARRAARAEIELAEVRGDLDLARTRAEGILTGLEVGGFQIAELLARGGMGEVYAALARDGARVALKIVRSERACDPMVLELFLGEARALGQVDSAHVARILEVGDLDAEIPFIAMELIEGRSLAERLRDDDRMGIEDALAMVRDVAAGLSDLHAAGLLHCDLKPQNLVQTGGGAWKLVDLGVARALGEEGGLAGTPSYMSPEQAGGQPLDERSDVYALGLVVYRALAGRPACVAGDPESALESARRGPPLPDLAGDVAAVLRVALAFDADARFDDAATFATALAAAAEGRLDPPVRARAAALPWASPGTEAP